MDNYLNAVIRSPINPFYTIIDRIKSSMHYQRVNRCFRNLLIWIPRSRGEVIYVRVGETERRACRRSGQGQDNAINWRRQGITKANG